MSAETQARGATGRRCMKFYLVGAGGIGVQLAALALLTSVLHLDYLFATAMAVETAVLHNFAWHERYTWADRRTVHLWHVGGRLLRFNLTTGATSILGNVVLMRLLVGQAHLPPVAANLVTIAACSLLNFLVSDRVVFRVIPDVSSRRPSLHVIKNLNG